MAGRQRPGLLDQVRPAGCRGGRRAERLTFVTGRRLGRFAREPWAPDGTPDEALRPYTVIELRLDANGDGAGTMSPAADVAFDGANHTVALVGYDGAPTLLAEAQRQPPPYWAHGSAYLARVRGIPGFHSEYAGWSGV